MSRAYCYQCFRPKSACLCGKINRIDNSPRVIILQHKEEVRHPRGSAIIAALSLNNCTHLTGEDFSCHQELNQLIDNNPNKVFLVFPKQHAMGLTQFMQTRAIEQNELNQYAFIFIDASWRKAKKIVYLSKNLHRLTSIELDELGESNYRIRKEPGPGLVSTLESIVNLLSHLESNPEKYQPLLDVFNGMIDRQIQCMGEEVYQKNYLA